DRLILDTLEARAISGLVRVELLCLEDAPCGKLILEVEAVPVDDRVAPENEPYRLDLPQRELVDALEPTDGRVLQHGLERINVLGSRWIQVRPPHHWRCLGRLAACSAKLGSRDRRRLGGRRRPSERKCAKKDPDRQHDDRRVPKVSTAAPNGSEGS